MRKYVVWNTESSECETYSALKQKELLTGYGYSSVVSTDDINGVMTAFQNETNCSMEYQELGTIEAKYQELLMLCKQAQYIVEGCDNSEAHELIAFVNTEFNTQEPKEGQYVDINKYITYMYHLWAYVLFHLCG